MNRTRMPGGLGMFGRRVLLRLLAASRDGRVTPNTRDVRPGAPVPFVEVRYDHEALDAAAGCEYLDDRIRLQE